MHYKAWGKRLADVVLASVGLAILALPLVLLLLAIRCDSPGPAVFRQTRIGQYQRRFRIIKLRTLPADRRQSGRQMTRLGRWLRRSGVDELPQLLNVLAGSMSLVGPRPLVPREAAPYRQTAPARFAVRPGITGLAQATGRHLSPKRRGYRDRIYVRKISVGLDASILLRTVFPHQKCS